MSGNQLRAGIAAELSNPIRANAASGSDKPIGRRSKFWFRLGGPTAEEQRQAAFDQPLPVPVDQEIITRAAKYQRSLPKQLESQIKLVREFFLQEIAPLLVAGSTGVLQAKEVMAKALGSEVDDTSEFFFNQLMTKAVNLKLSKFVSSFFHLDERDTQYLLNQLNYRRTLTLEAPEPGHPIGDDLDFKVEKRHKRSKDHE
jgi:hypothetical protein